MSVNALRHRLFALEEIVQLAGGKVGVLPQQCPEVRGVQPGQQGEITVQRLPGGLGVEIAGEGLRLLFRREDNDVPFPELPIRQFQHQLGAQCSVQPEIDHSVTGKFLFQQGAVHPKGQAAASHQHNARSGALFQQGTLVRKLAQETLVILGRQAKAAGQQKGRAGQ